MLHNEILSELPKEMVADFHSELRRVCSATSSSQSPQDSEAILASGVDNRLTDILDVFLVKTESRERCTESGHALKKSKAKQNHVPSATILHMQPMQARRCFVCESTRHETQSCTVPLRPKEKTHKLTRTGRCFRCTSWGHQSEECKRKVKYTRHSKRHASSVCNLNFPGQRKE